MSLLGTFVTSDDVRQMKETIRPRAIAIDAAIKACPDIDEGTRGLWDANLKAFADFYVAPDGFWSAAAEYDAALAFQTEMNGWQDVLERVCHVQAPREVPPTNNDTQSRRELGQAAGAVAGAISTPLLVAGGAALALVLLLGLRR
jgi:hypothetical protein